MVSWPAAFSGSWSGAHSGERPAAVAGSAGVLGSLVSSLGELDVVSSTAVVPLSSSSGAQATSGTRTRGRMARPVRRRMGVIVGPADSATTMALAGHFPLQRSTLAGVAG